MRRPVYVIFDDPADAQRAHRALLEADEVGTPLQQSILRAPIGQGRVTWEDSRALAGAGLGALTTGTIVALLLVIAAAVGGLALSVPVAALVGAGAGGAYGALLGAIAGSTEPEPMLARLAARLRPGQAAVGATYSDPREAERAREILLSHPGATASV